MKKIYLSLLALSVAGLSNAQTSAINNTIPFRTESNVIKSTNQVPQEKGALIWSDDFSTPANWVIANTGTPSADWVIGTAGPTGSYSGGMGPIASTSGGNFAMFDSDALGSGTSTQDATITTASPVSLTGYTAVSVSFESYLRHYNDMVYVEVSTDGINFTQFQVHGSVAVNASTANPELTTVNITSVAANQATVWIRFRFVGGWDYAWMVDDVEIRETDPNDLVADEGYYGTGGLPYTRIPISQIQPIDFFMKVSNVGTVDQTNTVLDGAVNGSTVATSTPAITIVAGTQGDSLGMAAQWTPPGTVGTPYNIVLTAISDSTDSSPANNAVAFPPLEVSVDVYAHDDFGGATGTAIGNGGGYNTGVTPPTEEFEAGNWFDIYTNTAFAAIEVVVGANAQAGAIIDAALYDVSSGSFVEVTGSRTAPYTVTATDASTNATISLPFSAAIATAPGTYFAVVHAWSGTGAEFFYGVSGNSLSGQAGTFGAQQSLIFYPNMANPNTGENFYTTATPMVRMIEVVTSVSEVENKINFNVYPNPSATGEFTIDLSSETIENVTLTVTNLVGQNVMNKTVAVSGQTKTTISLSDYSKGVYFLTVNNQTIKLIIE